MTKFDERWLENFNSFKEYVTSNAKLPHTYTGSSTGIGMFEWFQVQKSKLKQGKLTKEKIDLFNQIYEGILVKPSSEINRDLFIIYKKFDFDKYDPDILYLYRNNLISEEMFNKFVLSEKYSLSVMLKSLLLKVNIKERTKIMYNCMKDICNLPSIGICCLGSFVITCTNLLGLYLEDKYKFVDYYSVVLRSFEKDIKIIIEELKLPKEYVEVINLYYGVSSDVQISMAKVGERLGIPEKEARSILHKALRRISKMAKYDPDGKCTFGKLDTPTTPDIIVKEDAPYDPYTMPFHSLELLSSRVCNCLYRSKIYNYKDLHEHLMSVSELSQGNYINGLRTIRNFGTKCIEEICSAAKLLGIEEKVFNIL